MFLQSLKYTPQYRTSFPYVIFDVAWLDYVFPINNWFFSRMSPRLIIEIVTSVPLEEDYDPYIHNYMANVWIRIENDFDCDELINRDFGAAELLVECVVTEFYNRFNTVVPNIEDQYMFDHWIDSNTLMLKRSKLSYIK